MANQLKSMNEIKQVLRLHFERGESIKSISRSLSMSKNTVKEYIRRFNASGKELNELLNCEPAQLEMIMRPEHATVGSRYSCFLSKAEQYLITLNKNKHLTRHLLWEEEYIAGRTQYKYSQFCYHLQQFERSKQVSMVMQFKPADKLLIDFTGDKLYLTDIDSGELTPCEILVMTLAFSHRTIAVAVPSQRIEDLIFGLSRGIDYFGAVPESLVCDNMKSAVVKSDRYEPRINEALLDFANYYGMSILPTRVRKPKDKSRVEGSVNHLYQQVFARMRQKTYQSIEELNQDLRDYCDLFNQRIMKDYGLSRNDLYLRDEQSYMKPLPPKPYQLIKRYQLKVGQNNHVHLASKKQYYSVPYRLVGQQVQVVVSHQMVKVYYKGENVATHAVTGQRYTTVAEHMSSTHQAYLNQINPEWLVKRGSQIGSAVEQVIISLLARTRHPEQNYKSCQGILSLAGKHGNKRLNACCSFALEVGIVSYKYIQKRCENLLFDPDQQSPKTSLPLHTNIRGAEKYQ